MRYSRWAKRLAQCRGDFADCLVFIELQLLRFCASAYLFWCSLEILDELICVATLPALATEEITEEITSVVGTEKVVLVPIGFVNLCESVREQGVG